MTRKEMITDCVENQVQRGIIKEQDKDFIIKSNLIGWNKMGYTACLNWYNSVFGKVSEG